MQFHATPVPAAGKLSERNKSYDESIASNKKEGQAHRSVFKNGWQGTI